MRLIPPILFATAWSLAPAAIISVAIFRLAGSAQIWQGRPGIIASSKSLAESARIERFLGDARYSPRPGKPSGARHRSLV
jgi:hypothetical protein